MAALPAWRAIDANQRTALFAAALMHDIGKPATTREEDGRITSRGHSAKGASMVRNLLWEQGCPFELREALVNLIRFHQVPFWLAEKEHPDHEVMRISQGTRCDWLAILAEADMRGRVCLEDSQRALDNIALFAEFAADAGCFREPMTFVDPYTRYRFFKGKWFQNDVSAYRDFSGNAFLMSGLPGSGKDLWVHRRLSGLPMVSLDDMRRKMGVKPSDNQGRVIQAAKERARVFLRKGLSFVWNGTNLTAKLRQPLIEWFEDYRFHVTLVYVESLYEHQATQNKNRDHVVPDRVIGRMREQWSVPDPFEAHDVIFEVSGGA
ncbi:AAA family ATPase [Sulfidibacter corallicola]|uniref:AAA family ATPase n=2 Tax=Sulfidibacter corallicola TaxID=2818388 RepID=A0A8A4TGG8_SULCO|nr:AAA family ATPase [Sulfidibacter corallicola]